MAERTPTKDLMGYEALTQDALRGVVRKALERAAGKGGIPGEHHFYVTFQTRGAGVSVPDMLVEKYPDEMTIVLQHQFWDLAPGEQGFSIVLNFGGQPYKLTIPYAAVTRFYDPSVQFVLQFEGGPVAAGDAQIESLAAHRGQEAPPSEAPAHASEPSGDNEPDGEPDGEPGGPKIVSLDQFRKK